MNAHNTITGIISVAVGAYFACASRQIAASASRQQSRLLSFLLRREITLGTEYYRIPFILTGMALIAFGVLAIIGVITMKWR